MKGEENHNMEGEPGKIRECMEGVLGDLLTVQIEADYNAVTIMSEVYYLNDRLSLLRARLPSPKKREI